MKKARQKNRKNLNWTSFCLGTVLAVTALGIHTPLVRAVELEVDSAHSTIEFSVRHLMISNVKGVFNDFAGTIDLNEKDIAQSKVNFTVKVASIDTRNEKRDKHLRSPDFFDVEKFPEAKFVSQSIQKGKREGTYTLQGDMTLHGVTRPITLDATYSGKVIDPWKNTRHAFSAKTILKRSDFKITWNKTLEAGGVMLSEEVPLSLEIEAIVKAPTSVK